MTDYQSISILELKQKLQDNALQLIDIRDSASFTEDHIEGALNLSQEKLVQFIETANKQAPTVVYCYRGMSSRAAASYLSSQGFENVYTLDGGFSAWSEA